MKLTHIQEGDVGTEIIVQIVDAETGDPINLDGYADPAKIIFEDPKGVVVEKDAAVSDASAGKIKYVTVADFLSPAGVWSLQGRIAHTGNGTIHRTEVAEFKVYANIEA